MLSPTNEKFSKVLKPQDAAKVLNSNAASVRARMRQGAFIPPIGTACRISGDRYSYEIYPEKLAEFLNITVEDVHRRLEEGGAK